MKHPTRHAYRTVVATLLLFATSACLDETDSPSPMAPDIAEARWEHRSPHALSVYTQNLFLGGDTGPLFELDLTDPSAIGDVIVATNVFYGQVTASDIPERAAEFVNELGERGPDVVALQEAVGYATGLLDPATGAFTPTGAGPDLLVQVLEEISARGLPYSVAAMQPTTAIALPTGPPTADGLPALAVQDRVVMLKRNEVEVVDVARGLYAARIPLGPVELVRGWVRVTTEQDGAPVHFVATHLETQGSNAADPIRQVHNGQALELQASVLAGLRGTTILLGDLNSDALADESEPSWTPTYDALIADGFTDVWELAPGRRHDEGATCCQIDGPEPRTLDERIDFVLIRSDLAAAPGSTPRWRRPDHDDAENGDGGRFSRTRVWRRGHFRADVIGDEAHDRTPSGRWPSDHAGIVASIRLPRRR